MNFLLYLAAIVGFVFACSHHSEDPQLQRIRSKVIGGMHMSERAMRRISHETMQEAHKMLPMMDIHTPLKTEKKFVIEKDVELNDPRDHLFILPEIMYTKSLLNAFLSFYIRPVYPITRISIDVTARELGSDSSYRFDSHIVASSGHMQQLRIPLDTDLIKRWMDLPTQSIILNIECKEIESDLIVLKDDYNSDGKNIMLELEMTSTSLTRKRRSYGDQERCRDDDPGQECCITYKNVRFLQDLNVTNVISPSTLRVAYCTGQCKKESSFATLFGEITTKVFDDGRNGGSCCHAVESEPIDILYINKHKEVKTERIFDMMATKCGCA